MGDVGREAHSIHLGVNNFSTPKFKTEYAHMFVYTYIAHIDFSPLFILRTKHIKLCYYFTIIIRIHYYTICCHDIRHMPTDNNNQYNRPISFNYSKI